MPAPNRVGRVVVAVLALVSVAGCARSGSVRRLEQDTRSQDTRLAEIGQATEDLKKELAGLREQIDGVRRELAEARQADEARERDAVETVGKRLTAADKRLDALAGAVRGVEMSVGGLSGLVFGAVFIQFLPLWAQGEGVASRLPDFIVDRTKEPGAAAIIYGVVLILLMFFLPNGVGGVFRRAGQALTSWRYSRNA